MERKYFFHLKALSAILLCLLIFRHSPLCAGEKPVITLGDSNKAPHLIPQVIREDLTYWHFGIDNNNAHGVLAHASKGIEGDPGRIIVVPFNGKTRELDLSKILKGYPEKIILDEEGYLFVDTQVKFGCDYEVACISPRDKLLWVKSFIYSGDCKGGESWGISASLYQSASEIGVECYDRLPTGEFAMRIKKDSFRRYRLKDKLNNSWEEGREAKKKIWSEDSFRSNWYYFSIPRGMTGDGLIPYKNELNRTIGWVRLKESHNPKEGGNPSQLVDLRKDRKGWFYALYLFDNKGQGRDVEFVVLYAPTGMALGRYELKPGEDVNFNQNPPEHAYNDQGELFFVREREKHKLFDLLKLTPRGSGAKE